MKTSNSRELCGLVLAGGRSTRMGTDKAALVHRDGRTLARRTFDLLVEAGCETVVLSLRQDQEFPTGFNDLTEVRVARGPEGGSEECKPCHWMDKVVAPGVEEFLKTRFRGGLRARILTDGVLAVS